MEEIAQLRTGKVSETLDVQLSPDHSTLVSSPSSGALDMEITFERGSSVAAGLLLRAWLSSSVGEPASAPALIIDWEQQQLQV